MPEGTSSGRFLPGGVAHADRPGRVLGQNTDHIPLFPILVIGRNRQDYLMGLAIEFDHLKRNLLPFRENIGRIGQFLLAQLRGRNESFDIIIKTQPSHRDPEPG